MMNRVIAVANQKGGVGKTTTVINLAASLAVAEHSTLVVDMDPQANCTSGLGYESDQVAVSTYEVLIGQQPAENALLQTDLAHLHLMPANINLVGAELELVDFQTRERLLARALSGLRHRFRYILIDCPPSLGLLTLNSLTAADSLIIPVQAEYFALEGMGKLLNTIREVRRALNPTLQIGGILLTMYDERLRLSKQVAGEVRRYCGSSVFNTVIPRNVRLAEAPSHGKPVVLYDGTCLGARRYLALAMEVIARGRTSSTIARVA